MDQTGSEGQIHTFRDPPKSDLILSEPTGSFIIKETLGSNPTSPTGPFVKLTLQMALFLSENEYLTDKRVATLDKVSKIWYPITITGCWSNLAAWDS